MRKNPISKQEIEIIRTIIRDIKEGKLVVNHPLQRYSDMWTKEQQGNLIRRVLHDGRFLPILICTQYDEYGCEVRYLIDGVQRMTTFESYMNDEFAISKNTIDYMVEYDGIVYETKETTSGKFSFKRDRKGLIPVLDADGKPQRRVQSIDIRGLKYSELPPELQEKINNYKVSVELKLECSDDDIQVEILDYNSGTKMNDAQIGKNRLGAEFARIVIDLSNHSFIKNKCGFTKDNYKKGIVDRAINESLMLVNFGAVNWVTSHKDLCRRLSNWLTKEHTEALRQMFEELDEIISEDDEIKNYLTLKEFFVVIANYSHFRDSGYPCECYAQFLKEFITETSYIKNLTTGEIDDEGEEVYDSFRNIYMQGSKQKGNIASRLEVMNNMLDEYLTENCEETHNVELREGNFILDETTPIELQEFAQNFVDDSKAIQCLMMTTASPYFNFSQEEMNEMVVWYKQNGTSDMLEECLFYKEITTDSGISDEDANLPLYVYGIKYIEDNNIDIDAETWLSDFKNKAFMEIDADSGNKPTFSDKVTLKASEIIKNIQNCEKELEELRIKSNFINM